MGKVKDHLLSVMEYMEACEPYVEQNLGEIAKLTGITLDDADFIYNTFYPDFHRSYTPRK